MNLWVGAWLDRESAGAVAVPGWAEPETLHCTLAYTTVTSTSPSRGMAIETARRWARWNAPWPLPHDVRIGGEVAFYPYQGGPGARAYLLYSAPLHAARESLAYALEPVLNTTFSGWIPHVTVGPYSTDRIPDLSGRTLKLDGLYLVDGDTKDRIA